MSSVPIHVRLAHRCPGQFWSIEELFSNIASAFPEWVKSTVATAPRGGANPRTIVANLLWAASLRDCDVIHQTGDIHYAVLGIWRRPVVLTIHDLRFIEESRGLKRLLFWWWWLYLPCLRANRVTVISEFTKSRLLALCRVNSDKVRVIPNCVSAEFVAQPKPWAVVGMVGRTGLGPPTYPQGEPRTSEAACPYPLQGKVRVLCVGTTDNKNLTRVVEACACLDVRLCILGKPAETQRMHLAEQAVEHEVYQGLTREEVVALYQSCDLVCFVSTYEGFGMPILEGQAVGRPVLTSNISPMSEVAGEGALKVDPFDVLAIRCGFKRLMEDAGFREDLVQKGFRNVMHYTAESVAAQYAALYREVLERK
jgi:glycosyltransferase involved in cell wall biosynthesis